MRCTNTNMGSAVPNGALLSPEVTRFLFVLNHRSSSSTTFQTADLKKTEKKVFLLTSRKHSEFF